MLVAGAIGAGVTTSVSSGINDSAVLARARNREYAAEGAIDDAIVASSCDRTRLRRSGWRRAPVHRYMQTGMPYLGSQTIDIRVDCAPAPELTSDLSARNNVIFTACVDTGSRCTDKTAIITAEINYQVSGTPPVVTRTFVQTWSVNR